MRRNRRRRALGVVLVSTSVIALLADPGPSLAAVIPPTPTNAAVCSGPMPGVPVITSISRTPASVNVTHRAKSVTFTIKATDSTQDISGFIVVLRLPAIPSQPWKVKMFRRTHGTAKNGEWVGSTSIPRGAYPGTWTIEEAIIYDAAGGNATYSALPGQSALPWMSTWPKTIKVTSTKRDRHAPRITSTVFTPTSVDTSVVARTIHVTAKVTDDLSGVSGPIRANASVQIDPMHAYFTSGILTLRTGTTTNGTYAGDLKVPTFVGTGRHRWSVGFYGFDAVGNPLFANRSHVFTVTSRSDFSRPVLKAITISPRSVDARNGRKNLTVTAKLTDTHSGVHAVNVTLSSPSGAQAYAVLTHKKGTTWSGRSFVARCSEPGVWTVSGVQAVDGAGNTLELTAAQVRAKHITPKLLVKALDWEPPSATVPRKVSHTGSVVVTFTEPIYWSDGTVDTTFAGLPAGAWTCKSPAGVVVECDGSSLIKTASFKPTGAFTFHQTYSMYSSANIYDAFYNGPMRFRADFRAI
jgi:hypothetical protein